MAIELATAYVTLTTSAKGIQAGVAKELSPVVGTAGKVGDESGRVMAGGFKSSLTSMAAITGGIFAVSKVKDFFSSAIEEARESAKVNALTAQVIKTTGAAAGVSAQQVGDLATEISKYAGIDDEAIQAGENLLLTFTNVKNVAGEGNDVFTQATKIATDYAVATGKDVTSAAKLVGKALNDPIKASGALTKAGISLTDAQKDQIKAFVQSGDTLSAQKVILDQLGTRYAGAAKAAATPAQKLKVAWDNFKESIGTALVPVLNGLATVLTTAVIPALSGVFGWIGQNAGLLKIIALILGPLAAAWLASAAATKIAAAAQGVFNAVMNANPILRIISLIVLLVTAFITLWNKCAWFRDLWIGAWEGIKVAFHATVNALVTAFRATVNAFVTAFNAVVGAAKAAFNGVLNAGKWLWDKISGIAHAIGSVLSGMWDGMKNAAKGAFNTLARLWNNTLGKLRFTLPDWIPFIGGKTFGFPTIPTFAKGGKLQSGWNVVGELGPELVRKAGASAQVFSNRTSRDMVGGGQEITIGRLVELSGPITVRSDQDILDLSRNIARETNRRLRALGTPLALSGATP